MMLADLPPNSCATRLTVGAAAWLAAMYVGPVVAVLRSPFSRLATTSLAIAYVAGVILAAAISAEVVQLQRMRAGDTTFVKPSLVTELVQPLRW